MMALGAFLRRTLYFPTMMRMIRNRQCILVEPGITGEVHFVAELLGVAAC